MRDTPTGSKSFKQLNPHLFGQQTISGQHAVAKESDLHAQIMDYCRQMGWVFFHGAMCERTHRTCGEPDFIIFREGQCLLVECKSKTGKLSPDQQAIAHQLGNLKHTVHVVRSMEEFRRL
jgi:hypothetical protein